MKKTVVIQNDYLEKFRLLSDEQIGKLFRCMLIYADSGKVPKIDDPMVALSFDYTKVEFDKSNSRSGKNHWNWKNGITKENHRIRQSSQYLDFKRSVLERDNYTCQVCGSKNKLNVHHIKIFAQYPELRCDVNNGITLCVDCHRKVHKKNG